MAKNRKDPYDFGKWTVPEDWSELTFSQLCDMNRLKRKNNLQDFNIFEHLEVLTGKKRKEIENLPYEFLESIMIRMTFLKTEPPKVDPKPYIEVDGERYIANIEEKLTVAEYASIDTVIRTDEDDLVSIIAVLFRLPGEKYDEEFELNKYEQRKEMFGKLSCLKVLPAIAFFLKYWGALEMVSQLCSEAEGGIDQLIENLKNSPNSLGFKGSYMTRRKILRKLKKLKKAISTSSSSM